MSISPEEAGLRTAQDPLAWLALADLMEERANPAEVDDIRFWRRMGEWGSALLEHWRDLAYHHAPVRRIEHLGDWVIESRRTAKLIVVQVYHRKISRVYGVGRNNEIRLDGPSQTYHLYALHFLWPRLPQMGGPTGLQWGRFWSAMRKIVEFSHRAESRLAA